MKTAPPALLLLALLLAGCAAPGERDASGFVPVSGFADVHGLAVSPADPNVLYVATHHGLIRGERGTWARAGVMQDDLMGFSMHPAEASTFWTSGHPKGGGNMGVRQSTDGGLTWTTLWNERVDFHAMTVSPADPNLLWGAYAGKLYHSEDGGRAWRIVNSQAPPMRALVAHPTNASTLYATLPSGIATSTDAGQTWTALSPLAAYGVAIDPTDATTMYAGGQNALWKSTDGGHAWTPLHSAGDGAFAFLTVSPTEPATIYAATYETSIDKSTDGGATWTRIKTPSR